MRPSSTRVGAVLWLVALWILATGATGERDPLGPRLRHVVREAAEARPVSETRNPARAVARYLRDPRDPSGRVRVFLVGKPDPGELRNLGAEVQTRAGDVLSVRIPVENAVRLGEVQGVRSAFLANPLVPMLDASIPAVNADAVRSRVGDDFLGMTGEGVIIGVVDSGLDWTHEDFLHPDGTTRVLWYWDQSDITGPAPAAASGDTPYDYGTEWSAARIDAGSGPVGDIVGHGTHVAGIAAGDGSASAVDSLRYRYVGVAPEADLVVVAADLFLETGVLDAAAYVFAKAAAAGRPAVVNLSLGGQFGPHDGTTPLEQGLEALMGPGKLVVVAAGNAGQDRIHAELHVPAGGSDTASVFIPAYTADPDFNIFVVDCFYQRPDSMTVTVITPSGTPYGPYGIDASVEEVTGEGTLYLVHLDNDPAGLRRQVQFDVSDFNPNLQNPNPLDPPATGEWKVVFGDLAGAPGGGEVDLWIPAATMTDFAGNGPVFLDGYDPGEEVASPGNAERVVTVGSFNTKRCWKDSTGAGRCTSVAEPASTPGNLTYFSSRGPTRDGREKPDLTAPGFVIGSSLSGNMSAEYRSINELGKTKDPDLRHFVFAGTSMAAPHVSGALALLLQLDPQATPEEARARLIATAVEDSWTGPVWNAAAGNGKLDVAALVDTVTAVDLHVLELTTGASGRPRLEWEDPSGRAVAYTLERQTGADSWIVSARFPGPGPHVWTDPESVSPTRYRVWAALREGGRILWGEAIWTGGETPRAGFRAFPNPWRTDIVLAWNTEAPQNAGSLEVEVFDLSGRRVRRLEALWPAGARSGQVVWDGRDARGEPVPSGIYWIRAQSGSLSRTARVVRIR